MIIAVIADNETARDIVELLFTATKEKYVKFSFRDAKNAFNDLLKNLRVSSDQKYEPFKNIVTTIERSDKIVLVSDCFSPEREKLLRSMNAKFIHIGNYNMVQTTDLYLEKKPKTVKEITKFIGDVNNFITVKLVDAFQDVLSI